MKDLLMNAIQENVRARKLRVDQLDEKILDFSQNLLKEELRAQASLLDNDYFMKISSSDFGRLPTTLQMMSLALWFYYRTQSAPENRFSFESQKDVNGVTVDFLVSLQCGETVFKAVIQCDGNRDTGVKLEGWGYPVFNFSSGEIIQRPLEMAEEVFSFLDQQAGNND